MFEVWYWCWQTSEWRRLEGPDYDSLDLAVRVAEAASTQARRATQVRDLYTGEVLHQAGGIRVQQVGLHPAYW